MELFVLILSRLEQSASEFTNVNNILLKLINNINHPNIVFYICKTLGELGSMWTFVMKENKLLLVMNWSL